MTVALSDPSSGTGLLQAILQQIQGLPPAEQAKLAAEAMEATKHLPWIPNVGPQMAAYHSPADVMLYGGQGGGGKRLCDETPVPVPLFVDPTGFKRHGDLRPGDFVFSPSGNPVQVLAVTPVEVNTEAYEVSFDTGETIKADGDHLWHTWSHQDRDRLLRASPEWRAKRRGARASRAKAVSKKPWVSRSITAVNRARVHDILPATGAVRTTREIAATLRGPKQAWNHAVDVTRPIEAQDLELPIEPYLFGLWLGDGYSKAPDIGMAAPDWESIEHHLPPFDNEYIDKRPPRKIPFVTRSWRAMRPALRALGVWRNKHIPAAYLRASASQRLALMQGLLDTDGTCDSRGQIELGFSNERLARDALELACSLGVKAALTRKATNGADHWRFKFMAPFTAFRLPRKAERQAAAKHKPSTTRRYITGVRPIPSVPMRCIRVASEDGLYLVGRTFITTHNSGLILGLALTAHKRTLIVRRQYGDLGALTEEAIKFNGTRDGFNGSPPPKLRTRDGRLIEFAGLHAAGSEQAWQGRPHDLFAADEACQLLESQVRFLMGWVRTTEIGQRCRSVLASNPPLTAAGQWIVGMFRPWLDLTHPKPAKHGELRWFITDPDGKDMEVPDARPVELDGKTLIPKSRTFIPAKLADNPFLVNTNYQAELDALPEPIRSAVRDGNFMAARQDDEWQVIPSAWVFAAQSRWSSVPPMQVPMSAIGVDVAQGGADDTVLAIRHDGWFAPLVSVPGKRTPYGRDVAGLVVAHRRDGATVVIDMGGGYGGAAYEHLKANDADFPVVGYKGAEASTKRTADRKLRFTNRRSEAYWKFREALDPSQPGGSPIALPEDPALVADLTAPTFEVGPNGIKVETKEDVCKRLGRSTDRGDAVVMAWTSGEHGVVARARAAAGGAFSAEEQGVAGIVSPSAQGRPKVQQGGRVAARRNAGMRG